MTSTHLRELALGFVKHIVYAINSDKAATDSGSLTEHVVRNGQGEIVWRAYKNGTAAHRVAKAHPDYTVDSRKLTVTIKLGKWESEKEAPKTTSRGWEPKVGDRVRFRPSTVNNVLAGFYGDVQADTLVHTITLVTEDGDVYLTGIRNAWHPSFLERVADLPIVDPQIPDHKPTFQKGDRVRIQSNAARGFWSGKLGTVLEPWVYSQGRSSKMYGYSVSVDGRINDVAFRADELTLELAAWEVELLNSARLERYEAAIENGLSDAEARGEFSEEADAAAAEPEPKFTKGDRVAYTSWVGKRIEGVVIGESSVSNPSWDVLSDSGITHMIAESELSKIEPAKPAPKFQVGQEVKTFYQGYTVRGKITRLPVEGTLYAAPSPYYIVSVSYKFSFETVHRTESEIHE